MSSLPSPEEVFVQYVGIVNSIVSSMTDRKDEANNVWTFLYDSKNSPVQSAPHVNFLHAGKSGGMN